MVVPGSPGTRTMSLCFALRAQSLVHAFLVTDRNGEFQPWAWWLSKIVSKVTRMSVGSTADFVWAYPPLIYIYYIYIIYTYINQMYIFCRVMQQAGKCICSATCKLNIQKDAQISGRSRTRLFLWLHDWLHQSLHPWTSTGDLGHDFIVWCRWTQQFDFWELNKKQMGDLRLRATPKVS